MAFTQSQADHYGKHPERCPHCGSSEITTASTFDSEGRTGWQTTQCETCDKSWVDSWRLVGVAEEDMEVTFFSEHS